jgi:sarcosine oxidase subunit gamma
VTAVPADVALGRLVIVRGGAPPGFPVQPNATALVGGRLVLVLGPDEWLVVGGREDHFPDAAVDVSAAYVCLELSGPGSPDVLAEGCALDLDPAAFPVGACAQTLLARTDVIVVRTAETRFRILVRPSFADYVRAWLTGPESR